MLMVWLTVQCSQYCRALSTAHYRPRTAINQGGTPLFTELTRQRRWTIMQELLSLVGSHIHMGIRRGVNPAYECMTPVDTEVD